MQHLGEVAAVATAVCWAATSLFFGYAGRRVGAVPVNQFRLLAALPLLMALHAATIGGVWPAELPSERFWLLAASGLIGLVLGDLGYFHALAVIGPRLSSVVLSTWPAMALLLAFGGGEVATVLQVAGLVLTMLGVMLVLLRARDGAAWRGDLTSRQRTLAILAALVGAFGQAAGLILSRLAMQAGPDCAGGVDPLSATVVRMAVGCAGMMALGLLQRQPLAFVQVVRGGALRHTMLGTVFGPVVGVWLSMVAARHAAGAGGAAALMATTPLFLLPVARFAYGARIGWFGFFGTIVAVVGAILLLGAPA